MMSVRDVMVTDPVTVPSDMTLGAARALAAEHGCHQLPVVRGRVLLGVLEEVDLGYDQEVLRVAAGLQPSLSTRATQPVERLARRPTAVIEPSHALETAARLMLVKGCIALAVVAGGHLVGILTVDGLRRAIAADLGVRPVEPGLRVVDDAEVA